MAFETVDGETEQRDAGERSSLEAGIVFGAFLERAASNEAASLEELCRAHPALAEELRARWDAIRELDGLIRCVRRDDSLASESSVAEVTETRRAIPSSRKGKLVAPPHVEPSHPTLTRSLLPSAACALVVLASVLAALFARDAYEARAAAGAGAAELGSATEDLARARAREDRLRYAARTQAFASAVDAGAPAVFEDALAATPPELRGWEWEHLRLRSGSLAEPAFALPGGTIRGLALGPDGNWGVSLAQDERIRRWSTGDGAILATSEAVPGAIALALSLDGELVAVAAGASSLLLLHAHDLGVQWSRTLHADPGDHGAGVGALAFDPRALFLVAGGAAGTATVLGTESGQELATLRPERGPILDLKYSPDGARLGLTTSEGWLVLYEGAGLTREREILFASSTRVRAFPLPALSFAPDSTRLAVGSGEGIVRVLDAHDGRELACSRLLAGGIAALSYDARGGRLLAGTTTGELCWLEARCAELRGVSRRAEAGFPFAVDPVRALAWTARGDSLAPTSSQDPPGLLTLRASGAPISALAFSPDGEWLAASQTDGKLVLWSVERARSEREIDGGSGARALAWLAGSDRLLCATGTRVLVGSPSESAWLYTRELGGEHPIALAWQSESEACALTEEGGSWHLDPTTGELALRARFAERIRAAALVPDGSQALLESASGACVLVDASTGSELARWEADQRATALAFHPGGERAWLVGASGALVVLDTQIGASLASFHGPSPWIALAVSANGERVATAGQDGSLVFWETRSDPGGVRLRARAR